MGACKQGRGWWWLAAVLFYLCIALFYFRDALFTERVQVCGDLALSTYPWALEAPEGFKPRNVALSDHCSVFYPWFHYTAQKLQAGELPLWTPHALGGAPYMGNLSTAIFYPLNLLIAFIPLTAFFLVQSIIKVVAAGGFMYLFLRILGLRFFYALFGGMVYALCGYTILWVISHLTSVSVLMPALFWATEIYIKRRNGRSLGLITVLLALQFLGAQPETSLCICTAWGIYTFFRIRQTSGLFNRAGVMQIAYLGVAGALALGLVIFQLWPFLEYMVRSYGLVIRKTAAEAVTRYGGTDPLFTAWGIVWGLAMVLGAGVVWWLLRRGGRPLTALISGVLAGLVLAVCLKAGLSVGVKSHLLIALFPELYGNILDGVKTAGGPAYPEFNGGYVGVLGFLLAMVGWYTCRRQSAVRIMGALFLFSFGAVYGIPFIHQLVRSMPGFELTQPGRIISVTAFSLSALSAFGLDAVMRRRAPVRGEPWLAGWRALGVVIVAGLCSGLIGMSFFEGGLPTGKARKEEPSATGTALSPGEVQLISPLPGEKYSATNALLFEGRAGAGVKQVSIYLNGLCAGSLSLEESGERSFDYEISLERFEEGTYRVGIVGAGAGEDSETFSLFHIVITHPKSITGKNLIVFLVSLVVLALLFVTALPVKLRCALALGMTLVDLVVFGAAYNCTTEPEQLFPDNEVTDFLTTNNGIHRVLPENAILQPSTNYLYDLQVIRGYDGLELPEYNNLIDLVKKDPWVDIYHYNSKTLDYENSVIDLLGFKYIVSLDEISEVRGLKKVLDGTVNIYENTEAMPRAFVVGHWIDANRLSRFLQEDLDAALDYLRPALTVQSFDVEKEMASRDRFIRFVASHFEFKKWALVEEEMPVQGGGSGTVAITEYENEYVAMDVKMDGEGLLVYAENYFPGWIARVDGEERKIYRVDFTLRGIPLSNGEHKVELIYRPDSFHVGWKISLACLVLLVLFTSLPFFLKPLKKTLPPE